MNDPSLYSKANPFQCRDAKYVLKEYKMLHQEDTESDIILDIGCGTGNVTRQILAPFCTRFQQIVAIDICPEMIRFARRQQSSENIHYEVLDIAGDIFDFRNYWGSFSKVFSFYCLHWIKDLRKAISNIRELMKTDGECLLVFVARCPIFDMYRELANDTRWEKYMKDYANFIPITHDNPQPAYLFCEIMMDTGLQVECCEILRKEFTFPSVSVLKDCMCAINPFLERMPADEKNDYIADCLQTLAELKPTDMNNNYNNINVSVNENDLHFTYDLLIAQGRRL